MSFLFRNSAPPKKLLNQSARRILRRPVFRFTSPNPRDKLRPLIPSFVPNNYKRSFIHIPTRVAYFASSSIFSTSLNKPLYIPNTLTSPSYRYAFSSPQDVLPQKDQKSTERRTKKLKKKGKERQRMNKKTMSCLFSGNAVHNYFSQWLYFIFLFFFCCRMQLDIPLYEESFVGSTVEKSRSWYIFFFFFLSFLSPVLRRRDTFTQKHRAKTRLNNDHFLSSSSLPLPFLAISFSRFSQFAFFSIDSFRTRYNTQRIETRRNAANYIMRGLGRK